MKKRIGSNYGILVILLFAVVCTLTDYIIIEKVMNKSRSSTVIETNTDCVDSVCNCDGVSYDDIAGLYSVEFSYNFVDGDNNTELETTNLDLYLYTDGTYYYHYPIDTNRGEIGNYTIEDDYINLNCFFVHGSDSSNVLAINLKKLKIDGLSKLIDERPGYYDVDSVILVKQKEFTNLDNQNSIVKDKLNNYSLSNLNALD